LTAVRGGGIRRSAPIGRVDCIGDLHSGKEMRLSGALGGSRATERRLLENSVAWSAARLPTEGSSGYLIEEFGLIDPSEQLARGLHNWVTGYSIQESGWAGSSSPRFNFLY